MQIAVLSQTQGNLDAARGALDLFGDCQKIIHLGNSIGLGPDPKETLELFKENGVISLCGSYEEKVLGEARSEHIEWLQYEIGDDLIKSIQEFPHQHREEVLPDTSFLYWPRDWRGFLPAPGSPADKELERIFKREKEGRIFFGQRRDAVNIHLEKKHLLSPGSLGVNELSLIQGMVIHLLPGQMKIEERSAFYDPREVIERLKEKVPGF